MSKKYVLTTSANPEIGGTVSPTTKQYSDGDTAKLIALPAAEYELKDWSGDASGTLDTISVVMNSDKTVVANFVKKEICTNCKYRRRRNSNGKSNKSRCCN